MKPPKGGTYRYYERMTVDMISEVDLSIARWHGGNDVAFVWGIDEVGNIGGADDIDFTDWGLHFDREASYLQSTFLPTIERYPEIEFTIGAWLGAYNGVTPESELLPSVQTLDTDSPEWDQWADDVIRPLSRHDQIELAAHGLGHEDWVALDEVERHRRIERLIELFQQAVGSPPAGFNTWPYGTIPRESLPGLLVDHGLFVTGILTTPQLTPWEKIGNLLRRLWLGKRYHDVRNADKPLGSRVKQGPGFNQRIGEMAYWGDGDDRIVSLPYTGQLKGNSVSAITDRITTMIETADDYTSPTFYMFSHLRGTSAEQRSPARNPDGIEGQAEKFKAVLDWLTEQESLWFTTLSEAAMYHDVRESAMLSTTTDGNESTFTLDTADCLPWSRTVSVTLRANISRPAVSSISIDSPDGTTTMVEGYADQNGYLLFDCIVDPGEEPTTGRLVA